MRPRDRQLIWSPERSPALASTAHVGVAGRSPKHGWPQADRVTLWHVCKWPGMGWTSRGLGSRVRRGMGGGTNSSPEKDPKRSQSVSPSHAPPSPLHPLPPTPCRTHPSHFPMSHPCFLPSMPLNDAGSLTPDWQGTERDIRASRKEQPPSFLILEEGETARGTESEKRKAHPVLGWRDPRVGQNEAGPERDKSKSARGG